MSTELRDALEDAVDTHDEEAAEEGSTPASAAQSELDLQPTAEPGKVDSSDETTKAETKVVDQGKEPVSKDGAQQETGLKAPASWRPEARENWGKLDKVTQAEVLRREKEISDGMREASDSRRFTRDFNNMMTPYLPFIRQENANPMLAVKYMLDTAVNLRIAPPQQKAQMVADLIKRHNVDIQMLDGFLAGEQVPTPQVDPAYQQLQQQFAPVIDYVKQAQQREQQQHQQVDQQISQTLETFATDPKNEFFEDVREDMADILDAHSRRGQSISLEAAYQRACNLHPNVSKIVEQRKTAQSVAQQGAAARRARRAAVSVSSDGAPNSEAPNPGTSIRSAIEAATEIHSGRRQ